MTTKAKLEELGFNVVAGSDAAGPSASQGPTVISRRFSEGGFALKDASEAEKEPCAMSLGGLGLVVTSFFSMSAVRAVP